MDLLIMDGLARDEMPHCGDPEVGAHQHYVQVGTGAQSGVAATHPAYARGWYVLEESVVPPRLSLEEGDWW